ncbi:Transcription factor-like protein DPA [Vitis vinifera]|uniref:Transcription factor-like protein DPA n=1 Tax=Vitis vinifera TaxID=29760 RepID=A0A438DE74_VITVI|nr:Transcription factor-like protein DPA [Vitis vinifera]
MMSDRHLGDILGGFDHNHTGKQSPFSVSSSYDHTATASENTPGVNHLATDHENNSTPLYDSKEKESIKNHRWGLRQFSIIVCKKVENKRTTTYSEVADEIIAEFAAAHSKTAVSLDEFDEKNIRRRVYDALNVLMALDIITRDKKEIRWKGLPTADWKDIEEVKALRVKLMTRMEKKTAYLKDLEDQGSSVLYGFKYLGSDVGLQNLMLRNQQLLKSGNVPSEGFPLPFILVQTSPHATVEIEISEDMQLVHFDFNSTPFSLHDDAYILKLMRCYQLPAESRHVSQSSSVHSTSSSDIASGSTKPFYWNSEMDTLK